MTKALKTDSDCEVEFVPSIVRLVTLRRALLERMRAGRRQAVFP